MEFLDKWADFYTVVSIALTIPFLCYCIEIAYLWWPAFKRSFRSEGINAASSKLARGIWVGFVSNFLDNLYWGVTWLAFILKWQIAPILLGFGPFFNVFFRQAGGLVAAREHVDAASMLHDNSKKHYHKWYWIAGAVTGVVLWFNI